MNVASVHLWGRQIGAVRWDQERQLGFFEYTPEFQQSGIQLAPIHMPLGPGIFSFPGLSHASFHGLPGMLADVLPDRFGNAVIDAWLASQGRPANSLHPVERLCYTGSRGMGALEFRPAHTTAPSPRESLDLAALVALANRVLQDRTSFRTSLAANSTTEGIEHILRVGTSAGGARAKAVIAWNPQTEEVRAGDTALAPGFESWVLKFDGVSIPGETSLEPARGYGLVEYAYHHMAVAAGIQMSPCRILAEGGRHHFMTKRFDRTAEGQKLHMQSLCAVGHFDFQQAGAHSYEQAMLIMRELGMSMEEVEEQFRRMVFHVLARNQDDHTKNIAFLMDKQGHWFLSPAFDETFSYNPEGIWTNQHQMSINGKLDGFCCHDLEACAQTVSLKRGRAMEIYHEVKAAVQAWPEFAEDAGVPARTAQAIQHQLRGQLD